MMTRKVHIVLKDSVASDAAQREEALRRIEHHYHVTSQTPPDRLEYGIVTALATDDQIVALRNYDAVEAVSEDEERSAI